jgi:hypothetical protein
MTKDITVIRKWLAFFMIALFLSGVTAIPLEAELSFISRFFERGSLIGTWLDHVTLGLHQMNTEYPFLAYGYDWLAFAHFIIAILFIGPYRDPVKNKWVIEFGILACILIIPFALIAGHFRGIPFWWRLIDCSFGLFGLIPLIICRNRISDMEDAEKEEKEINYVSIYNQ